MTRITPADADRRIVTTVEEIAAELIAVSREIHAHPEVAFEEHRASSLLADVAARRGFSVQRHPYDIPTSFRAERGSGDFVVTICAEYDALPEVGHACGHNIIAAASLGAAIALADLADDLGLRVVLLGTPAEELGGGKTLLLDRGAWNDATVSLMAHGRSGTIDRSCRLIHSRSVDRFNVTFLGEPAHAAIAPEQGRNAADAATLALVALGLLRQQLADTVRTSAYVLEGGTATNIIPARTVVRVEVRDQDNDALDATKQKVLCCFDGAARATGCSWSWETTDPRYASLRQHPVLADAWDSSLRSLGRDVLDETGPPEGSTDMGNVSLVVPSIHPHITVLGSTGVMHSTFVEDAVSPEAELAILDAAKALSMSVAAIASHPQHRADLLRSATERRRSRAAGTSTEL